MNWKGRYSGREAGFRCLCLVLVFFGIRFAHGQQEFDARAIEQANRGVLLARQAHYSEAVDAYKRAIQIDPRLPNIYLNLGLAWFKWGKFRQAVGAFEQEQRQNASERVSTLLAMSHYGLGEYRQAASLLEPLTLQQPDNSELSYLLAKCYIWSGESKQAMNLFQRMLQRDPNSPAVHMLMGEALDAQQRTDAAIAEFLLAVKENPTQPDVHFGLGYLYWKQKRFDEAEKEFQEEEANNSRNSLVPVYLGDLAMRRGDHGRALQILQQAIVAAPNSRLALLDLGILESGSKEYRSAEDHLRRAIALDPQQSDAHYRLANVYRATNRPQLASQELARVTKMHETSRDNLLKQISGGPAVSGPAQPDQP